MSRRKSPSRLFAFSSLDNFSIDRLAKQAAEDGDLNTLKLLWAEGIDLRREDLNLLVICSAEGHIAPVIFLIDIGVDIHTDNDLALMKASENGHLVVVKYLLEKGADVSVQSDLALKLAASNGYLKVVRYLMKCGSVPSNDHINIATKNGHDNIRDYMLNKTQKI